MQLKSRGFQTFFLVTQIKFSIKVFNYATETEKKKINFNHVQGRKFLVESGGDENFPKNIFGLLLEPKYSIYLKLGYFWSPSRDFWH